MRVILMRFAFAALSIMTLSAISAQSFNDFVDYVNSLPSDQRTEKTDSLLANTESFPITEDGYANFIYNGSGANAQIAGDFTGWNPENGPMTNVSGTQFWYLTVPFENAARVDYKIVTNGSNWNLDPLNPFTAPGGFGANSELRMPDYVPPIEIIYDPSIPHGTLESTSFFSTNMNDTRTIQVYLPPGYDQSTQDYRMVLMHDGLEYLSFGEMDNTLDYLIHNGLIPPMIGVFVPPVDRTEEYHESEQSAFTEFICIELMAWLDEEYRILDGPENRAVIGSSSGGNISVWLSMIHPEVFGKVGAFSPYIEPDIISSFQNASEPYEMKVYMTHGLYDHLPIIHQSVAAFEALLDEGDYEYLYELYPESHSYGFWRARIDDALIYLFGSPSGLVEINGQESLTIYPNPFTSTFVTRFELESKASAEIRIFDGRGALLDSIVLGRLNKGLNEFTWTDQSSRLDGLKPGMYHVCLVLDNTKLSCRQVVHTK